MILHQIPRHKPVVVTLGADSSSDDDSPAAEPSTGDTAPGTASTAVNTPDMSLQSSIDNFLKAARASVEVGAHGEMHAFSIMGKIL